MAAGATYEPIATTTLGSAAASITFSSIPATYTDLRVLIIGTQDSGGGSTWRIQFNSDTATNYSDTFLLGDGSNATSGRATSVNNIRLAANVAFSTPTFATGDVFSYAGSTFKTVLSEGSGDLNGSGYVARHVGLWRSTSAITSVKLFTTSGNLLTGTTATLYGIKNA